MSSASAVYGQPELAVYSATKFAVRALTEALDIELRPKGVRVADITPGYVDTPMVSSQQHRSRSLPNLGAWASRPSVLGGVTTRGLRAGGACGRPSPRRP